MTTLFLVGTPIGNLADITYRAIDTLQQVDLIACEDTRVTRKLCNHYDIKTPLKSYHEHNKDQQTDYMIEQLLSGIDIALVSDAGLPLISDPGYELVVEARQHDIKVETIPGPNAGLTALMASGLPSYTYTFLGFLPRKDKEKQNVLSERMFQSSTLIIYESPHRVTDTLKVIDKIDSQRRVSLGRELTKKFEQIVTADVNTLLTMLQNSEIPLKGEFVILIEGAEAEISTTWFDDMSIEEHVDYYIKEKNIKPKAAIKMVAEDRQSRTSEIYNIYHQVD
ncbi:16S rRNA (cytidine(1402)-2'-O)-methyltransferase [Staphylococcus warneri]|jgi:16S rRNA (cytidine1402-2'-O)-methyltransferase|uniref:Ribosomal RNA small subunit methyltransferase I n=1 Tax=Staphylococcus warneri TaxID=1292 RepID=A0A364UMT3_STAWA|nr:MULTISPECIES: 16S rRNA (cytidine(1402)-2'-O)-methyltransferase [Staphylococcus]MBJ7886095.1 16S rRNA (cytidine(1402)-2'-O)-methyltransferase [Bacillaceae bacterium HSR45]MBY4091681.1 16S rRNA (cytidine(1402)-2'-O)-methyltransferase [Rhodococcus fascians]MCC8990099.1 16S rRNA (cytidine(1402)-2'-O)-methyltransferase [Staphylococcus sp.]MDU6732600.1 16S rRNA (cytidine(1402)-2'-O)-methyltransferase [Staphylococcus epidermidis]PAK72042.1 rRNA (cytidine-2'-O-)-methyltransferase [Staphylococcus pa